MLEHQQSHTDNYRFRCSSCNKGFTRQSYYRDHKCLAAGDRTEAAGQTAEEDEVVGVLMAEEDGEEHCRRGRFTRKVKESVTGDDREDESSKRTHREEEEQEEGRRTDEGCQAAMSINTIEGQTDRKEVDEMGPGFEALEQIETNNQNCLQPPCS